MNIAVDWSYTKGLTTYDGKKVRVEDRKHLLRRLRKLGDRGEQRKQFIGHSKSNNAEDYHTIIIEEGCPISLMRELFTQGNEVLLISNRATEDYRVKHRIDKSDEDDAKIIWKLATSGAKLKPANFDGNWLQIYSLYKRYRRCQKARLAMEQMKRADLR